MNELTDQVIGTLKDAASKLTGAKRRAFQAKVAWDYLDGSARRAERVFGWRRKTVELGLNELRTGITCRDNTSARGNRKTEATATSPWLVGSASIQQVARDTARRSTSPSVTSRNSDEGLTLGVAGLCVRLV